MLRDTFWPFAFLFVLTAALVTTAVERVADSGSATAFDYLIIAVGVVPMIVWAWYGGHKAAEDALPGYRGLLNDAKQREEERRREVEAGWREVEAERDKEDAN